VDRFIERLLIAARWLLVPIYLGLALLLVLFIVQFFRELYAAAVEVVLSPHPNVIAAALGLVDLTLLAGLVVMVMLSGYENFVSQLEIEHVSSRLARLARLDQGSIKVKLAVTIVAISAINLLQAFLEGPEVSSEKLLWRIAALLVFVSSAVALAILDRVITKSEDH
jgi:uncharacterized protein (TIGR00645 family)